MATAYDVIQVSIRTNETEHPSVQIECQIDWSLSRVKQQIQISHPRHYPTENQVVYYGGNRVEDSISLSRLFTVPTQQHTLWLAIATENSVIEEFISLSRSTSTENKPPNSDVNPYYSALQYYNYINSKRTQTTDPSPPPIVPPVEQEAVPHNPEFQDNQEEFNFLGGRHGGVGLEEAQEQNAILNAIHLIVRLTLLLYITYQFAPQYKFYLVVAFSAVTFLYQVGIFRINRVNILRHPQVEQGVRERDNNENNNQGRENTEEGDVRTKPVDNPEVKSEVSDGVEEVTVATEGVRERTGPEVLEGGIQNNPGVLNSLSLLLYNLVLSFHPEHNV